MKEEKRSERPQEPVKGEPEDVEAPGVERPGDPSNPATADALHTEKRPAHRGELAEDGEEEVDVQGTILSDNAA